MSPFDFLRLALHNSKTSPWSSMVVRFSTAFSDWLVAAIAVFLPPQLILFIVLPAEIKQFYIRFAHKAF